MPKKVRHILENVGDNSVLKIQLGRTPVETVLIFFLNLISFWKFQQKQIELGYDEIYHNYLLITIQDERGPAVLSEMLGSGQKAAPSTIYKLEKAHRVRLMKPAYPTEFVDVFDIPLTSNKTLTLNRLITTASNIDKHFYTYDAGNNNMCQTFVENIVDINGLTPNIADEETRTALKPQDAKALVATLGSRSDIVKRITDLGGTLDKLVFDKKIRWKKPVTKEFAVLDEVHIKIAIGTANNNTHEVPVQSSDGTVIVEGMQDTIVENPDDVYDAVVKLEEKQAGMQGNQVILIVTGIVVAVLIIGTIGAIIFVKRRRRRNDPAKKARLGSVVDRTTSESSTNVSTEMAEQSQKN